jgi:hypothetical protein
MATKIKMLKIEIGSCEEQVVHFYQNKCVNFLKIVDVEFFENTKKRHPLEIQEGSSLNHLDALVMRAGRSGGFVEMEYESLADDEIISECDII